MSEEFINQVTLNCLMNKDTYNKYVKNNTIKLPNSVNKKDKKFYKKRIYNIIKQLLSSQETEIEPRLFTDVQKSFDNFVKRKYTKAPQQIMMPQQKDINLRDPNLKIKGIKDKDKEKDNLNSEKKKNITNIYDKTENTEKKNNEDDKK